MKSFSLMFVSFFYYYLSDQIHTIWVSPGHHAVKDSSCWFTKAWKCPFSLRSALRFASLQRGPKDARNRKGPDGFLNVSYYWFFELRSYKWSYQKKNWFIKLSYNMVGGLLTSIMDMNVIFYFGLQLNCFFFFFWCVRVKFLG